MGGSLSIFVKSLPSIEIDGSATVNITETEKLNREPLHVNFWGTTILDEAVTTFDDAVKYTNNYLRRQRKARVLLALAYHQSTTTAAILNSISKNVVEQSALVLNNLENLQI